VCHKYMRAACANLLLLAGAAASRTYIAGIEEPVPDIEEPVPDIFPVPSPVPDKYAATLDRLNDIEESIEAAGGIVLSKLKGSGLIIFEIDPSRVKQIEQLEFVEFVEEDMPVNIAHDRLITEPSPSCGVLCEAVTETSSRKLLFATSENGCPLGTCLPQVDCPEGCKPRIQEGCIKSIESHIGVSCTLLSGSLV